MLFSSFYFYFLLLKRKSMLDSMGPPQIVSYFLLFLLFVSYLKQTSCEEEINNNEGILPTKTATRTTTRIGFGSCHKNKKSASPPIWDVITAVDKPNIWIWTGDAVYPSDKRDPVTGKKRYGPADPVELKNAFNEMKMNRTIGYHDFLSNNNNNNNKVEIYGTWDDHDYGGNDSGSRIPDKEMRQNVFWDFLGYSLPPQRHSKRRQGGGGDDDGDDGGSGVYHSVDLEDGKIQLILLDTRSFRQDHCIPSLALKIPLGNAIACFTRWLTVGLNLHNFAWLWGMKDCQGNEFLGEDQWKWLEDTLIRSSPASESNKEDDDKRQAILIVSSVQVFTTNPAMEGWGHFPKEQERLWNLLQRHYSTSTATASTSPSPPPVFFLSGDVHHGEISGQSGYMEVTSSGLTHHCGQPKLYGYMCKPLLTYFKKHRHVQDEFYIGLNYGMIYLDWIKRTITFQIKDATGSSVLSYQHSLDDANTNPIKLGDYKDLPHTWDGHLIPLFQFVLLLLSLLFIGLISRRRIGLRYQLKKTKGE